MSTSEAYVPDTRATKVKKIMNMSLATVHRLIPLFLLTEFPLNILYCCFHCTLPSFSKFMLLSTVQLSPSCSQLFSASQFSKSSSSLSQCSQNVTKWMTAGQNKPRIEKNTAPNSEIIGARLGTMAEIKTVKKNTVS